MKRLTKQVVATSDIPAAIALAQNLNMGSLSSAWIIDNTTIDIPYAAAVGVIVSEADRA